MVRLDKEIAVLADRFVLARIVNMRGVDLNVFDFDFDLTWVALFLNAEQKIYGRYGGRDEGSADKGLSLAGLKDAMRAALESYAADPEGTPAGVRREPDLPERYPAARRLKPDSCIHCHQIYDFRREQARRDGSWNRDGIWVYPPPENVGISLDVDVGGKVAAVKADSPAHKAGLQPGDRIVSANDRPVASYGDFQYALHYAPKEGTLPMAWKRGDTTHRGTLELKEGWRQSDISWRASMWGIDPAPCVYGQDLTPAEKRRLGLAPDRLAFRQGKFVPTPARKAGIRGDDIILGIDDKELQMTMLQFNVYVRLNYKTGDTITFNVIRDGKRLNLPMVLPDRAHFD